MMLIIGIDPGLAHFGYSVVNVKDVGEEIIAIGVFTTKPSKDVPKTADLFIRSTNMSKKIEWLFSNYRPLAIGAERFSYPPQAQNAVKMAISWGIVGSISARMEIPVIMNSPQTIKKKICGRNDASKQDIEDKIVEMYPNSSYAFKTFYRAYTRENREHAFDATAAAVVCLGDNIIVNARRSL